MRPFEELILLFLKGFYLFTIFRMNPICAIALIFARFFRIRDGSGVRECAEWIFKTMTRGRVEVWSG
jgi:hypothetical protein